MSPRIGSLFSGAAGLDMAVEAVTGGTVAWHAEVDPAASRVLAYRFPGVPNHGDVTAVDWREVEPVDVICGGSPCQDVSHAGRRAGMRAGTRSGLWASMVDAIDVLRPRLVCWENVRGVLSAEADSALEPCAGCVGDGDDGAVLRALGRVLGDLAELGYDARWCGVRAADVGAPHGRFRVFVVATDTERGRRAGWTPDARRGTVGRTAAAGTGGLATADAAHVGHERSRATRDGWPGSTDSGRPAAHTNEQGSQGREPAGRRDVPAWRAAADADRDALRLEPVTKPRSSGASVAGLDSADASADPARGGRPDEQDRGDKAGQHERPVTGASGGDRSGRTTEGIRELGRTAGVVDWGQYEPAIRRWEHVIGRPAPAPTEPGPRGGQRLSPRLTEWMMGWPDGWVTDVPGISRNDALKLCGNGVVPQQAAEALRRLLVADERAA